MISRPDFAAFLADINQGGGLENDDLVARLLPLFTAVRDLHEVGQVAPVRGLTGLQVDETGLLSLAAAGAAPTLQRSTMQRVERGERRSSNAVIITGSVQRTTHLDEGGRSSLSLDVLAEGEELVRPVFVTGYSSWELEVGHHDALADIFVLGSLLASLATGLDFFRAEDLQSFVLGRGNLYQLFPRLHPVLGRVISEMCELSRTKRVQDLAGVVPILANYRDIPANDDLDFGRIQGFGNQSVRERRRVVQERLRNRLFDISRRNRLLYFKPNLSSLNLTVASVPPMLDYRHIRADQLLYWHPAVEKAVAAAAPINLGKYLRFEDAPYIQAVLEKIVGEARRDRAEYGFAQLRLVPCFLRWHNLKENPHERILSPLLLLPVELTRKKGVRDSYVVEPTGTEAEVNPVLRHHLQELYGLQLPEWVDLAAMKLADFHADLQAQIRASEPGVTLRYQDQPRIQLIHERARQRLDQWKRRQKRSNGSGLKAAGSKSLTHSYNSEDFRPRGLQLFSEYVRPAASPLRSLGGDAELPTLPPLQMAAESGPASPDGMVQETSREMYSLETDSGNPYVWDLDLCSVTLGNFHYRKMTLLRDYNSMLESGGGSAAFDSIFSLQPRPTDEAAPPLPLAERYAVVPGDATQTAAIARSRDGASYTIQGPPGTGKSQTITNLIADYVARGKRVLFVCEKRAAIDVVFHRLGQQHLQEQCCLIHDSQTDKKAFIQDLKATYEGWLARVEDGAAEARRLNLASALETELDTLQLYDGSMSTAVATPPTAAFPGGMPPVLHQVVRRMVEIRGSGAETDDLLHDDLLLEQAPPYEQWLGHRANVEQLYAALAPVTAPADSSQNGANEGLASHPLAHVGAAVLRSARPLETLRTELDAARVMLRQLQTQLAAAPVALDGENGLNLDQLCAAANFAVRVAPLTEADQLGLLVAGSKAAKALDKCLKDHSRLAAALEKARAKTTHWREKLEPEDTTAALLRARALESSFFRFFIPEFYRLRQLVMAHYDFSAAKVRPTLVSALEGLDKEYAALTAYQESGYEVALQFGFSDLDALETLRATTRPGAGEAARDFDRAPGGTAPLPTLTPTQRAALVAQLARDGNGRQLAENLAALQPACTPLWDALANLLSPDAPLQLDRLEGELAALAAAAPQLPRLLPFLTELLGWPAELQHALRTLPLTLPRLEFAAANRFVRSVYHRLPDLPRLDAAALDRHRLVLDDGTRELRECNAHVIRARLHANFLTNVRASSASVAGLPAADKEFKRVYATGRRELEHEFGKTMRYRSIRDLVDGETGRVVRDLKTVWLMSPLSVSDTLPLQENLFDVVIFDEASQIPVEEAIPALHRAPQVIVVGDEMQLPPTTFFATSRTEEESVEVEEDGELYRLGLDASSLLTQSAANLPSTMLAWHYRSRYEALISFSNAAFYGDGLYTIPDREFAPPPRPELLIGPETLPGDMARATLERSISFHRMERSPYVNRRNPGEAAYIAQLVREILLQKPGASLGIVAFSEAQQDEIERALEELASSDTDFATRLAEEETREEDGQFCGLFVKNLENVQGDERDIIVLSVCYGPDAGGRMVMNFGPINQRGGEKRLNVIFSRARHHMAIVASFSGSAITNDYNDGAAALKNYLEFAAHVSRGDGRAARAVLAQKVSGRPAPPTGQEEAALLDSVVGQLVAALRERGHVVDANIGQSRFVCDLGVRGPAGHYQLGILVDTAQRYLNPDTLERHCTQPGILAAFGWRVVQVQTRDWLESPDTVLENIQRALAN